MWIWAVLAALVLTALAQYLVYRKIGLSKVRYTVSLQTGEVFEGDDVFLYETLENIGRFPLPFVRLSTDLPDGLEFILVEETGEKAEKKRVTKTSRVQSLFVLRPGIGIRRRLRVRCQVRGKYEIDGAIALGGDLLGMRVQTMHLVPAQGGRNRLVVLPRTESLSAGYICSFGLSGDLITNHCPVTDPLYICGARPYTDSDPMNRINWKQTAMRGELMVREEEKTVRFDFNILLNMNTRPIELHRTSSDTAALERNIRVCASLFDRAAASDVPVRLITNTASVAAGAQAACEDGVGAEIYGSRVYCGRGDTLDAFRLLASVRPTVSVPADQMLEHIAAYPELYRGSRNFVVVSAYLDTCLVNFCHAMTAQGCQVVFYLTTSRADVRDFPADAEIYYKTY